ncbi:MAG: hypothetical protein DCF20_11670 [Pseudanabaena sp.]|nr:MAG: hypothetical protein DCF20_11670 [Pseudanabaena sp.]
MSAIANSNQPEDKPKTSRVQSYWRNFHWNKLASLVMAIALCFYLTACGGDNKPVVSKSLDKKDANINITEVSPPKEIQRLSRLLDQYAPQVSIVSPKPDEVLNDTQVSVKFDVKNLPIFKNADFGLGPHIHVTLDNQEYKAVYDLNQTATFDHLSAGTHTIRAFASRPWHESFKNQGAYAQTTFNVLTKTGENTPEAKTPLLTYSRPVGTYGSEPIMLDFYLQNAPLHLLGKDDEAIDDWQVRATIDGLSFTFDRWDPIYLKGFKTGQNWVKLELLEPDGDPIANVFNSTAHIINYQPNGTDTLARLVRGEKIANIDAIVNPDYVPPAPEAPAPEVTPAPVESVSPAPAVTPAEKATETPKVEVSSPVSTSAPVSKEEIKPTDKNEKAAPTSVIPVVPAPVIVPVVLAPVIPAKSAPEAIAPVITKTTTAVEPIKVKSTQPTKVAPVTEPVKITPESPKVKTSPVLEPVKVSPAPIKSKYAPIAIPGRPSTPKVKVTPQETTPKEAPKEDAQIIPKAETAKDVVPEKSPNESKPTNLSDYFKSFSSSSRQASPSKSEMPKPMEKTEVKTPSQISNAKSNSASKAPENPPALTDLSSTTSLPIKVLTK